MIKAAVVFAAMGFAALATIVTGFLLHTHVRTVLSLRSYGDTDFPLIEPMIFLPLLGVAATAWLLWHRRKRSALAASLISFALALLFWLAQAASRAG